MAEFSPSENGYILRVDEKYYNTLDIATLVPDTINSTKISGSVPLCRNGYVG